MPAEPYHFDLIKQAPVRVNPILRHSREEIRSLDDQWTFSLDPKDEGISQNWFEKPEIFKDSIVVPGCWQGQGFGSDGKDEVWDFRIKTRVFRATYQGTGWYSKSFPVPKEWRKKRIWLNFGGVHPSAKIWLNGKYIGSHSAPFVPFGFDVTDIISFATDNLLTVRVCEDDRWLGLAFNCQGNWSGLYRGVEIRATGESWLKQCWVHPDVDAKTLKFRIKIGSSQRETQPLNLIISAGPVSGKTVANIEQTTQNPDGICVDLSIPSPKLWSPESPNLYRVDVSLKCREEVLDGITERVGFVKLSTKGKHFLINDEPYYLRGTGEFAVGCNPETASPDTSWERWRRKLLTLKEYGYNYVRCQSYVPAPEYYDIADEVGLLIQGEMGMLGAWGGNSNWHTYAWPKPSPYYYPKLKWQWEHTVMRDVNHPSANIYCMSNELRTGTDFPRIAWECYHNTKGIKPTTFVIWTDGGYNPKLPGDFVNDEASIDKNSRLPVIQHEFRWWSAYPDIRIKDKDPGAIRPYAIEMAEKAAQKNNMDHLLPIMAENSQKLQYVESRTKLEDCRRDNVRLAGISHFSATDFSLSPQGILNEVFEKKMVEADLWRQTMGDTVILIDKGFDDRIVVGGETLKCSFFVSDFSHPTLERPVLHWELLKSNEIIKRGELTFSHQPFCTHPIGKIDICLPKILRPEMLIVQVNLCEGSRIFRNQWSFWIFPQEENVPASAAIYGSPKYTWLKRLKALPKVNKNAFAKSSCPKVLLSELLTKELLEYVRHGGRLLLVASEGLVRPFSAKLGLNQGRYFFLPPANYPPYEDGNSGTVISWHPMLGDFPQEGFADLQFYRLIAESPPLDLKPLEVKEEPVIRAISTYQICHPLAYIIEFTLGKGGLIISSLNLDPKLPEARYLLSSILRYAAGHKFVSRDILSSRAIDFLVTESQIP